MYLIADIVVYCVTEENKQKSVSSNQSPIYLLQQRQLIMKQNCALMEWLPPMGRREPSVHAAESLASLWHVFT